MPAASPAIDRFMDKFIPEPMSGCWLWDAALHTNGYGAFNFRGRADRAHRVSWVLFRGEIPDGHDVCHKCDTPTCVNPDHLFVGTPKDNMLDCARKDRIAFGERRPTAKLTGAQVAEILISTDSARELAERFGVSQWAIFDLRKGRTWRRIKEYFDA